MKRSLFILFCVFLYSCSIDIPDFWPTEIIIKARNSSDERIDSIKVKAVNGFDSYLAWKSPADDSLIFSLGIGADTTFTWKPKIEGYGHVVLGRQGYLLWDSVGHVQKYYNGSRFESKDPACNTFYADSLSRECW